jgi:putative tryptophan/tyrosine transport system substrate-binding protein
MSTLSTDIAGKRLALLKEALPSATRISILWNRPSKGAALILHEMQAACKKLGIEPQDIESIRKLIMHSIQRLAIGQRPS